MTGILNLVFISVWALLLVFCSSNHLEKKPEKVEPPVYKEMSVTSAPVAAVPPTPAPTAPGSKPQASSATPAATPQSNTAPSSTPALVSYCFSQADGYIQKGKVVRDVSVFGCRRFFSNFLSLLVHYF